MTGGLGEINNIKNLQVERHINKKTYKNSWKVFKKEVILHTDILNY